MNKHSRTPFASDGQHELPRQSAITAGFTALLPVLSAYIRAERDLEDISYSLDPAYSEWHRESEAAQDHLIDILHGLRNAPLGNPMDAPLRKVGLLIHAMGCDPEHARALHQTMDAAFETRFRVPGHGAHADHRKVLLNWARPLIADFVTLPIFDQAAEDELEPGAPA